MPSGITDPNSTLLEAERDGVSRRAVQYRRKKEREQLGQTTPEQPRVKPIIPASMKSAALEVGPPKRISPITAAGRAGAIERAIYRRLEQAVEAGDLPAARRHVLALTRIEPTRDQHRRRLERIDALIAAPVAPAR